MIQMTSCVAHIFLTTLMTSEKREYMKWKTAQCRYGAMVVLEHAAIDYCSHSALHGWKHCTAFDSDRQSRRGQTTYMK